MSVWRSRRREQDLDEELRYHVGRLLAVVSLVACCLPARGASRVDPVRALRQE